MVPRTSCTPTLTRVELDTTNLVTDGSVTGRPAGGRNFLRNPKVARPMPSPCDSKSEARLCSTYGTTSTAPTFRDPARRRRGARSKGPCVEYSRARSISDTRHAADIRLRNARRVRNAVRLALRNIEELSSRTEPWVLDELKTLEAFTADLVDSLVASPSTVVH